MLELLQQLLDWLRSLFFKREMELAMIGLNNAGKSTLVELLASGTFKEDMQATVGFELRKITKGRVVMKLWDVAGQPRFRDMWERYCRNVNAIVYVVDAADTDRLLDARNKLHDLMERPTLQNVPLLVLGNKNDLPQALNTHRLKDEMGLDGLRCSEYSVYSISCKNQTNISQVLDWLVKHSKS